MTGRVFKHLALFNGLSEQEQKIIQDVAIKINNSASDLFKPMAFGSFLSQYKENAITGTDLLSFIKKQDIIKHENELNNIGTNLLNGGFLRNCVQKDPFLFDIHSNYGIPSIESVTNIIKNNKIEKDGNLKRLSIFKSHQYYALAVPSMNSLFLYDSDISDKPEETILFKNSFVQYSQSSKNGIQIDYTNESTDNKEKSTTFITENTTEQEEWIQACINSGAIFREPLLSNLKDIKSFFELNDRDMKGNIISMEKYRGNVVIVVNVSSKCGLTPSNYTELAILHKKYHDKGLTILAFPCNQFANQEPGTHDEIMEFVKQYDLGDIPFFEKADVNGANARPVFAYCKEKLPGTFGNFVKWNFTKFLIDRQGNPVKRFAPKESPLTMEEDIKILLEKTEST